MEPPKRNTKAVCTPLQGAGTFSRDKIVRNQVENVTERVNTWGEAPVPCWALQIMAKPHRRDGTRGTRGGWMKKCTKPGVMRFRASAGTNGSVGQEICQKKFTKGFILNTQNYQNLRWGQRDKWRKLNGEEMEGRKRTNVDTNPWRSPILESPGRNLKIKYGHKSQQKDGQIDNTIKTDNQRIFRTEKYRIWSKSPLSSFNTRLRTGGRVQQTHENQSSETRTGNSCSVPCVLCRQNI